MLAALSNLLYSLANIPGLGFLRGLAGSLYQARYTAEQAGRAKQAVDKIKSRSRDAS